MLLNNTELTDRHNRPSVGGKVAIRTRFYNNGAPVEPYDVSSVTIFSKLSNSSPDSIVDASGLIKEDQPVSSVVMNFAISGGPLALSLDTGTSGIHDGLTGSALARVTSNNTTNSTWFPDYVPGPQASGIYRTDTTLSAAETGTYIAVLDGQVNLSGAFSGDVGSTSGGTEIKNDASTVQEYIDVWTVKMSAESNYQLFINTFKLFNDNYLSIPEPLLLTPSNRLVNKHVTLDSTMNLKITTAMTVNNKTLDEATKNILQDYSISGAQVKIQKINEGSTSIDSHEDLTGGFVNATNVTADNTVIFSFVPQSYSPVGGKVGTYAVTAKYTFLTETIVTAPFYFSVS
jgi:hypothetical protein